MERSSIADYAHRHLGRPAVVVGGAPSRLTEIEHCPSDAVWFSANQHGLLARGTCDYIVSSDDIGETLKGRGAPVISRQRYADVRVFELRLPNSAALAAWCAWIMGCAPIVVIGVECYQGATYAHDPEAESSGFRLSLQQHLKRWRTLAAIAPSAMFRAIGGPLLEVFPRYDALDRSAQIVDIDTLRRAAAGVSLQFRRRHDGFEAGQVAQFSESEARRLIAARVVERRSPLP